MYNKYIICFFAVFIITYLFLSHLLLTHKQTVESLRTSDLLLKRYSDKIKISSSNIDTNLKYKKIFKKLKLSNKKNVKKAENPSELLEAIRQIKTGPDGKTYGVDYKFKEFSKAIERNKILSKKSIALDWEERGPGNVSGRSRALIVDPDDPSKNTWFVGTVGGGVWKTTNGGISWENKTPELTTLSTVCMAMSESNDNVIYVGTGMGFGRTVDLAGNGIWKSTDRGETWTNLSSTANGELLPAINRIVVDPNNENTLLVCSNGDYTSNGPNGGSRISGIFRSTDGGGNWTQVYDPAVVFKSGTDNRIQQLIANPSNFNEIYAAVNEIGVIKSNDGGLTWTTSADNFADPADIGFGEGTYQGISTRTELAIAPSDPRRIYASVERRRGISKLFMSKDAGLTWSEVIDQGNNPNWFSYNGVSGANAYTGGWFDNTIVVHPYDEDIVFVGGIEIYRININPNNNTRSTTVIAPIGTIHVDHHALVAIPINESTNEFRILNANDGGVGISKDGGDTWEQISGLGSTQFYGIDKKPGEDMYIGGTQDNGSWISPNNPQINSNWSFVIGGDGFETVWNYWDSNLLMGCSQGGNYSRSIDGGITWNSVPEARAGYAAPFISKIANSKSDPYLLFTVGIDGVKRSDDFGASWTLSPLSSNWIGWRAFDNVEISLADPQIVWISSRMNYESFIGRRGGIHISKDGGLSFEEISDNFPPTVVESSGISTDPYDPGTAYFLFSAAGKPKVLRTRDYGNTFEDISGFSGLSKNNYSESNNGFPDVAVYQILVMPYNTDIIWAGTEIGLFISEDNGVSWTIADNGFPNVGIFQMSIVDDQIIVATYGRGIWSLKMPELADHAPNQVTLVPRLNQLIQNTEGDVEIKINLRSDYDSTNIYFDNGNLIKLGQNSSPLDSIIYYPITKFTSLKISVSSFNEGREYKTPTREIDAAPILTVNKYITDFSSPNSAEDFIGASVNISTPDGFSNPALHFPHPYPNAAELTAKLKNPVRVAENNATIVFDEVVLVEEGIVRVYTDPNFFDYVIVEGSLDGNNWKPLVNGYDSRDKVEWSIRYNSSIFGQNSRAMGDESLFQKRQINLHNSFNPNDVVFIRFRLHSDPLAYGWGWAVDNLQVQSEVTEIAELNLSENHYSIEQNYPNPFNPLTTIKYRIPRSSRVELKIFDSLGREIETLVNKIQSQGEYEMQFDATGLSSGLYFYNLVAGEYQSTKKMILLK